MIQPTNLEVALMILLIAALGILGPLLLNERRAKARLRDELREAKEENAHLHIDLEAAREKVAGMGTELKTRERFDIKIVGTQHHLYLPPGIQENVIEYRKRQWVDAAKERLFASLVDQGLVESSVVEETPGNYMVRAEINVAKRVPINARVEAP